jgi:dihydroorotate dehydrogenase/Pyruvate/2-oxoacid:ferredoxin oxidoreductase delta subunit
MDLLGIDFRYPLFISSGPLTRSLEFLKTAEDAGVGAVSTKLAFSKLPYKSQFRSYSIPGIGIIQPTERRLDFDEGLELVRRAREETSLVIAANVSGVEPQDWGPLCRAFEEAGAHFIEANYCCPHLGLTRYLTTGEESKDVMGATIGQVPLIAQRVTGSIKEAISVPLICKLPPSGFQLETALACESAGADAVHIFGGSLLALPPVDIKSGGRPQYPLLLGAALGSYHGPCNLYSTFRYVAEARSRLKLPVIASGGIKDWEDAIMMMMWGASAVGVCTHIIWHGFEEARKITRGMEQYLEESEFTKYENLVGCSLTHLVASDQAEVIPGAAEIDPDLCKKCGQCIRIGHCNAIWRNDEAVPKVDAIRCIGCGVCANLCPAKAITMKAFQLDVGR